VSAPLERRRAAYVLEEWTGRAWPKEAVKAAQGLPAALRAQGLMVTVAGLHVTGEKQDRPGDRWSAHRRLADLLARWLLQEAPLRGLQPQAGRAPAERLLSACKGAPRPVYRQAQTEALALAEWIKRIAQALGADEDDGAGVPGVPHGPGTRREAAEVARARLEFALERVLGWETGNPGPAVARLQGLPVQVASAGLPTAVADLMRAESVQHRGLAEALAAWLLDEAPRRPFSHPPEAGAQPWALLRAAVQAPRSEQHAAQAEALALLEAMKAYATALYRHPTPAGGRHAP
jgi:hypothetical protein